VQEKSRVHRFDWFRAQYSGTLRLHSATVTLAVPHGARTIRAPCFPRAVHEWRREISAHSLQEKLAAGLSGTATAAGFAWGMQHGRSRSCEKALNAPAVAIDRKLNRLITIQRFSHCEDPLARVDLRQAALAQPRATNLSPLRCLDST
jgi:hypothetical protein